MSLGSIKFGECLDCLRKFLLQAVGELVRPLVAAVKRLAERIVIPRFVHYVSKLNLLIRAFFSFEVVAAVFCGVTKEPIRQNGSTQFWFDTNLLVSDARNSSPGVTCLYFISGSGFEVMRDAECHCCVITSCTEQRTAHEAMFTSELHSK